MRAAAYTGTRNLYEHMIPAMKSLMINSPVDKIYLMIEDDEFPYPVPDCVEVINLNDHMLFHDGPNMNTQFTPYCMMRAATAKLLPKNLDRVLQLDVDTLVEDSLEELWNTDLEGKYFGAVPEYLGTFKPYGPVYYNCGVMLLNLEEIRRTDIEDRMIELLQTEKMPYIDQDAWNKLGVDKAQPVPVRFNETFCNGKTERPAIVHFAGYKNWTTDTWMPRAGRLRTYRCAAWPSRT